MLVRNSMSAFSSFPSSSFSSTSLSPPGCSVSGCLRYAKVHGLCLDHLPPPGQFLEERETREDIREGLPGERERLVKYYQTMNELGGRMFVPPPPSSFPVREERQRDDEELMDGVSLRWSSRRRMKEEDRERQEEREVRPLPSMGGTYGRLTSQSVGLPPKQYTEHWARGDSLASSTSSSSSSPYSYHHNHRHFLVPQAGERMREESYPSSLSSSSSPSLNSSFANDMRRRHSEEDFTKQGEKAPLPPSAAIRPRMAWILSGEEGRRGSRGLVREDKEEREVGWGVSPSPQRGPVPMSLPPRQQQPRYIPPPPPPYSSSPPYPPSSLTSSSSEHYYPPAVSLPPPHHLAPRKRSFSDSYASQFARSVVVRGDGETEEERAERIGREEGRYFPYRRPSYYSQPIYPFPSDGSLSPPHSLRHHLPPSPPPPERPVELKAQGPTKWPRRKKCRVPHCPNISKTRQLCKRHGGGERCHHPGCLNSAKKGGLCIRHGGGRCYVPACTLGARRAGLCGPHFRERQAEKKEKEGGKKDGEKGGESKEERGKRAEEEGDYETESPSSSEDERMDEEDMTVEEKRQGQENKRREEAEEVRTEEKDETRLRIGKDKSLSREEVADVKDVNKMDDDEGSMVLNKGGRREEPGSS